MTRKLILATILALTLGIFTPASAEEEVVRRFDREAVARHGHPRLLLDDAALADFKAKLEGKGYASLKEMDEIVKWKAREVVVEDKDIVKPSDKTTNLNHLLPLAYCYRVHSDEIVLPKLKKDLLDICRGDWGTGFLGISENSLAVSLCYDWIWDRLSESERKEVSDALASKMLAASSGAKFHGISGNWTSICNGGVIMASLAVWEDNPELAAGCFDESIGSLFRNIGKVYGGGGYPEGFSYWNYGSMFQICIIEALRSVFGHDGGLAAVPGFLESCRFALYAHSSTGGSFSFADGGATNDHPLPAAWWFAAELGDAVPLYVEKRFLDSGKYKSSYSRMLPAIVPLFRRFDPDAAGFTAPVEQLWSCGGEMPLCIVRRGWSWKGDVYLGIKGGYADTWETMVTSHGHMDAGSFVFETDGVRWSDDVMRPSYGPWFSALKNAGADSGDTMQDGLRWNTFNVSNLCHSCLIAGSNNGSIPNKLHPGDYNVDGSASISVIDEPARKGAVVDMSAPMKGQVKSARRTIVVLEDGTLEVTDEVEALPGLDCPLEWRMLTKAKAELFADGIILSGKSVRKALTASASDPSIRPEYALIAPEAPESWKSGWYYCQPVKGRTIASWHATVPAGNKITFTTRLAK